MVCKWHFNKVVILKKKTKPAVLIQLRKQLAYRNGYITTPYQVSFQKQCQLAQRDAGFFGGGGQGGMDGLPISSDSMISFL